MNLLRRRPKLPAALRPALGPDERVVAWAALDGDQALVATNHGLWLPGGKQLGWHEIHKAAWSGRELRITPAELAEDRTEYVVLVDGPVVSYLLLEPGQLPDQVRSRVTRSVAYTSHHPLNAGGVRVVGRRVPGKNGLSWAVRYDAGTPVKLPAVTELTGQLVAAAQEATAPPE
ncbi:hypothetical protein BJ973_005708 [Actinoplanes tereljensis]|uniref:Uncharacterized protein n=1 Tax=Paractinoplanes tereljensis TaxID=571912 RepID=A0A919NX40_9ACTN|nr:hypothetical protein [Actinoplanes tereljensis]GIF26348.1 hypothetical protein Ate02nite_90780 [Actinoplanes tereljensis]